MNYYRTPPPRPLPPVGLNPRLYARLSQRIGPVQIVSEGIAATPAVATFHPGLGRMVSRHPDLGESYLLDCPYCGGAGALWVSHLWMTADPLTDQPRRHLAKCSAGCLKAHYRDFEERVWGQLDAAGRRELATYRVLPGRPRG